MTEFVDMKMVHGGCLEIARQLHPWKPDIIVGFSPNNMMAAKYLSTFLNVPLITLTMDLENDNTTSDCELPELAMGYDYNNPEKLSKKNRKQILVMVDYNKNNEIFNWIEKDWTSGCFPNHKKWATVFRNNVRYAALIDNVYNTTSIDYNGIEMGESNIIFPWDKWWL